MDISWITSIFIPVFVMLYIVLERNRRQTSRLMKEKEKEDKESGRRAVSHFRKELKEYISDLKETLREYDENPNLWNIPREEGGRISNIEKVKDKLERCEEWANVLEHRLTMEVEEINRVSNTLNRSTDDSVEEPPSYQYIKSDRPYN